MYGIDYQKLMKMIGNNIRDARKAKGLSQGELAVEMLVASPTISQWETGKSMPRLDNIFLLCKFLDVDLNKLIDWESIKGLIHDV